MKKTIFDLALFMGMAFSVSAYANLQEKATAAKTETVSKDDKKSSASGSETKKDADKKDCAKKCEKSCSNKESK